jgi:hypothetical protein
LTALPVSVLAVVRVVYSVRTCGTDSEASAVLVMSELATERIGVSHGKSGGACALVSDNQLLKGVFSQHEKTR